MDKNLRVIKKLERITGLLEVNLKEDSALEDFFFPPCVSGQPSKISNPWLLSFKK